MGSGKSGGEPPHSKMAEALGRVARQLHRLQVCVAFDELFCAAAGETDGNAAIVVFAFHANHRPHPKFRMAHLLA